MTNASAPNLLARMRASALVHAIERSAVLRNGALVALWVLVWQLGRLVEYTEHASVWFPVAGLTFSVILLDGWRSAPGPAIGCVLVTLWVCERYAVPLSQGQRLVAGLLFAAAHVGTYALGAFLLRAIARRGNDGLPSLVLAFLLIAALTSLISMGLGMWVLVSTGMMAAHDVERAWLAYWIGDMAGVMVMAPFFAAILGALFPRAAARFSSNYNLRYQNATSRFKYKLLLNVVLLSASMLLAYSTRSYNSAFAIFFLVLPYMWIACTEPAFYNVLAVALGSFVIALLVHLLGLKDVVMVYQFAINVIAANALFGLALPSLIADNDKLRRVAETDSLTGAASRAALERQARHEIERCRRVREPLALVVFDIDYFKKINDLFGHAMGDRALRQVCAIAQRNLRPSDMLGRVGGDEFVALLPGIGAEAALAIAERIRAQVHTNELESALLMTASFGVAELRDDDHYQDIFERADRALYVAKQQGRNRAAMLAA
ncbi:diguanylate cyclase [Massilia sp. CF038]|uniref:GGDEF domain-containing protein n=1 Tax=Massilia sp. CF038 TaxID=1881045 RepID=UPI00091FA797|nr:diguanylate cyclase [Massilia sp. CF038]SHG45323.1 diguanylate cyclase (GGDEF) domain-containing protein [Massilia sp. CF038]